MLIYAFVPPMPTDPLRHAVLELLRGGSAHLPFDHAVDGFPPERAGERAAGLPHTAWQLVEHLRFTQRDILDFCRDPDYRQPDWPDDYWPDTDAPPSAEAWQHSLDAFRADHAALTALVEDAERDLTARIPHGDGQTYLREALLAADHNAYHLGQLVDLRRALGLW